MILFLQKMRFLLLIPVIFLTLASGTEGFQILVTSLGISGSQNLLMYRMADFLGQRGHDVTMLKYNVFSEAKSIKLKFAKELVFDLVTDQDILEEVRAKFYSLPWEQSKSSSLPSLDLLKQFFLMTLNGCEKLIAPNSTVLQQLQASKFDVMVIHLVDFCTFGLTHHLGVKYYIWMSTAVMIDPMAYYSGVPYPSSWVPSAPIAAYLPLSMADKMKSFFISSAMQVVIDAVMFPGYTKLFRQEFGENYPSLAEIASNTSLYFINSDPFFEYPRPILHNTVYIGGFTMNNPEPLEKDWAELMGKVGPEGAVVFSLGTVVNTKFMPKEYKMIFLNAFKRFPKHTFIWRLEGDFPEVKEAKNVHVTTWLPQKDLLGHPKVKAFITHGGYNSLMEATFMGVPLIMFPAFGDQYANVVRVQRLGVGVLLEKESLDEAAVVAALEAVLLNNKIQVAAKRLGRMMQKKPVDSLSLALNWVEFLAEFGPLESLLPESRHLSFFQYYLLDCLVVVLLLVFLFVFLVFKCCRWGCRKFCRKTGDKRKKE